MGFQNERFSDLTTLFETLGIKKARYYIFDEPLFFKISLSPNHDSSLTLSFKFAENIPYVYFEESPLRSE